MNPLSLIGSALCLLGALIIAAQYFFGINHSAQDLSSQAFGASNTVDLGSEIGPVVIYLSGFFIAIAGVAVIASATRK